MTKNVKKSVPTRKLRIVESPHEAESKECRDNRYFVEKATLAAAYKSKSDATENFRNLLALSIDPKERKKDKQYNSYNGRTMAMCVIGALDFYLQATKEYEEEVHKFNSNWPQK